MGGNNEVKGEKDVQWWSKVSIKEWAVIVGAIGFFYLTIVGGVETLNKNVEEIKQSIKEDRVENKTIINEIRLNQDKMRVELEILKTKFDQLEKSK